MQAKHPNHVLMKRIGWLLSLAGLWACGTSLDPAPTVLDTPHVQDGTLQFASMADYDAFLASSPEEFQAFFAARGREGFVSYADAFLSEEPEGEQKQTFLVEDHIFSRMLNEDAVVKIGPWYLRINAPEGKVFALHADHYPEHYEDLVGQNTSLDKLLVFATTTEVLTELEGLDAASTMAGRGEFFCDGASNNTNSDNKEVQGTSGIETHSTWLRYLNYGIGFTLEHQVKWRYRTNNNVFKWDPQDAWNVYSQYQREYEVRCGDFPGREWNDVPLNTAIVSDERPRYHFDIYRGSRKLSSYRVILRTYFTVPTVHGSSNTIDATTKWLDISSY